MMKTDLAVEKPYSTPTIIQSIQKLKTFPSQSVLVGITLAAVAALIGLSLVLLPINSRLKSAGHDIVEYELAFTADNANEMLHAWGMDGQKVMSDSLYLDFPFLLSYGLAFSGLTLIVGRALTGRLAGFGLMLAPAGVIAALCDAIENLILFTTLGVGAVSPIQPLAAGIFASVKFFLWGVVCIYCIVGGAAWAVQQIQKKRA